MGGQTHPHNTTGPKRRSLTGKIKVIRDKFHDGEETLSRLRSERRIERETQRDKNPRLRPEHGRQDGYPSYLLKQSKKKRGGRQGEEIT